MNTGNLFRAVQISDELERINHLKKIISSSTFRIDGIDAPGVGKTSLSNDELAGAGIVFKTQALLELNCTEKELTIELEGL